MFGLYVRLLVYAVIVICFCCTFQHVSVQFTYASVTGLCCRACREDEEFHDSFEYPPVYLANDHETSSPGVRNGQSSTPRATTSDVNDDADDIAALIVAIAQAMADNEELECQAETVKLKAELHTLHQ